MNKIVLPVIALLTIPLGYFFRAEFGRTNSLWLIAGLVTVAIMLKLVQLALQTYVQRRVAKMSPQERAEYEKKRRTHA